MTGNAGLAVIAAYPDEGVLRLYATPDEAQQDLSAACLRWAGKR